MLHDGVRVEVDGAVLRVTLDRPEKRNAINLAMQQALLDATHRFAEDDGLRVMLLGATGPFFSAGADISGELQPDFKGSTRKARHEYGHGAKHWHRLGDLFETIGNPIVAAHVGPCLGGALELSL
ncbi:hypothetical protein GVY41_18365 [Frigidibacter albus]|uniref:Enoyl-CoA hydratase/isomerase family protein n=1 Tax=Frigidibacter albus TaxID=1465486 RepID=A0A6L8VNN1_9RHOB|nr:hypothetical protein [Frigidibacter albus]NBE32967.1 hypothetical protein [Frigidibacter albus]GGH62702.1 hypothetical protein GCM10011341_37100 [Frigidibacter albus]